LIQICKTLIFKKSTKNFSYNIAAQRMEVCNRTDRLHYGTTSRTLATAPVAAVAPQPAATLLTNPAVASVQAAPSNPVASAVPLQPDFSNFFNQYSGALAASQQVAANPAMAQYIYQPALAAAVLPYGKCMHRLHVNIFHFQLVNPNFWVLLVPQLQPHHSCLSSYQFRLLIHKFLQLLALVTGQMHRLEIQPGLKLKPIHYYGL
jgi:hypothetical protein